jgi:hypothetical protein
MGSGAGGWGKAVGNDWAAGIGCGGVGGGQIEPKTLGVCPGGNGGIGAFGGVVSG